MRGSLFTCGHHGAVDNRLDNIFFEVPALGKILLYLVVVVLLAPSFRLRSTGCSIRRWIFPSRYLSRVTQVTAFVLLAPLLSGLGFAASGSLVSSQTLTQRGTCSQVWRLPSSPGPCSPVFT